ncbi:MAG: WXG100 family type VII secretion target [Oscillospiraceae bacterium]
MTAKTLLMNYQKAAQQSARIEQLAEELRTIRNNRVSAEMNTVAGAWSGDGANAYFAKVNAWYAETEQAVEEMVSVAAALRKNAKTIYNAEMRALELARTFSGGGGSSF